MQDINTFISWDMLANYGMFVGMVFMVVQVIKELPKIKNIPTRFVSITIALILQILVNIQNGNFQYMNIILYLLSSIVISLTANGLADATIKLKDKGNGD
jgi:hypothetical protein